MLPTGQTKLSGEMDFSVLDSVVVLYLVKEFVSGVKKYREHRRKRFDYVVPRTETVYEEMNALMNEVDAGRVMLLKAHNGGDRPALGKRLYSSAVYEVYNKGVESIKHSWQGQELDESYIKMLVGIIGTDQVVLDLGKMEDGMLKKVYFTSGVYKSVVVKIAIDDKDMYYMSINFNKPIEIDAVIEEKIRRRVNKIRRQWA